jgi:LmbE family N-acetylglucosaminyl deacetylase
MQFESEGQMKITGRSAQFRQRVLQVFLCVPLWLQGCVLPTAAQEKAALGTGHGLAEAIEAIEKARVVTRVLYVTAHPDDESGAVLSWLSRGAHADVALLSLTRGEGGQNALGPEHAPQLGLLRTEELLNAARIYGVKVYFGGAEDFGFTKTPEEALQVWGQPVVANMVQVIREFRPHILVNNWGGVRSGHGQHQAAGILTPQAVEAAADPKQFPEAGKIHGVPTPWRVAYVLEFARGALRGEGQAQADPRSLELPVNDFSAVWGMPYSEIGVEGYAQHRTQGVQQVRQSAFFRRLRRLTVARGENFDVKMFSRPLRGLGAQMQAWRAASPISPNSFADRLEQGFHAANNALDQALGALRRNDFAKAARDLAAAGLAIAEAESYAQAGPQEFTHEMLWEARAARSRIDAALRLVVGARVEAYADRSEITPGSILQVTAESASRGGVPINWKEPQLLLPDGWSVTKQEKSRDGGTQFTVTVPTSAQPDTRFRMGMEPWPAAPVVVKLMGQVGSYGLEVREPVVAQRLTSTSVQVRPLMLVPALTLTTEPRRLVLTAGEHTVPREVVVRVHHYATAGAEVHVGMDGPSGWQISPAEQWRFEGPGDRLVKFTVTPPARVTPGEYALRVWARSGNTVYDASLEPLPTLPTRLWSEPATVRIHAFQLQVPQDLRVGYVAGDNDPIPEALKQLGVQVELLDEGALAFGDLKKYDAIAIGIRAYELRQDLIRANQRLLDYAAAGGTLLVQYQRGNVWNALKPAPYRAMINDPTPGAAPGPAPRANRPERVTDEASPVRLLAPQHALLHSPHKIGEEDFRGWVQERGLYFWTDFDEKYTPLLALHDPGEPEATGALVVAAHGKGAYIYTGLAFFRQIPAGVPGAYRLLINLLSSSKKEVRGEK